MTLKLERLLTPYEFEERAGRFIREIEKVIPNYPLLLIEAENKTLIDLEQNTSAIKHLLTKNSPAKLQSLYRSGFRSDIESSRESKVLVCIYGDKKRGITSFKAKATSIGTAYGATLKDNDIMDYGNGEVIGQYRYFLSLIYIFRA